MQVGCPASLITWIIFNPTALPLGRWASKWRWATRPFLSALQEQSADPVCADHTGKRPQLANSKPLARTSPNIASEPRSAIASSDPARTSVLALQFATCDPVTEASWIDAAQVLFNAHMGACASSSQWREALACCFQAQSRKPDRSLSLQLTTLGFQAECQSLVPDSIALSTLATACGSHGYWALAMAVDQRPSGAPAEHASSASTG